MVLLHPERITHLITMGASLRRGPAMPVGAGDRPSEGLEMVVETYRDASPEKMRALAHPEHLRAYVDGIPRGAPIPFRVDRSKIPDIQVPTSLIHGRDDRVPAL